MPAAFNQPQRRCNPGRHASPHGALQRTALDFAPSTPDNTAGWIRAIRAGGTEWTLS